jgi:hypothetical protein
VTKIHFADVLAQRCLSPNNARSITLSVHCLRRAFPVYSSPKASFWIISCTMLSTLGPFLPPSHSCLDSPDDVMMWNDMSICHICPPEVAKGSFSEHPPLYLVLTLSLCKMLDVTRNGPPGGKLCNLCQG